MVQNPSLGDHDDEKDIVNSDDASSDEISDTGSDNQDDMVNLDDLDESPSDDGDYDDVIYPGITEESENSIDGSDTDGNYTPVPGEYNDEEEDFPEDSTLIAGSSIPDKIEGDEPEEQDLDEQEEIEDLGGESPEWDDDAGLPESMLAADPYDNSDAVADLDSEDGSDDFLVGYDPTALDDTITVTEETNTGVVPTSNGNKWLIGSLAGVGALLALGGGFLLFNGNNDDNNVVADETPITTTTTDAFGNESETVIDNDLEAPEIDTDQDSTTSGDNDSTGSPIVPPGTGGDSPSTDDERIQDLEERLAEANERAERAEEGNGNSPVIRTTTVTEQNPGDDSTVTSTAERTVTRTVPGAERTVTRTTPGPERVTTSTVTRPGPTVTTTVPGGRVTVTTTIIERLR